MPSEKGSKMSSFEKGPSCMKSQLKLSFNSTAIERQKG
jgi:hypothetical protein